MTYSRSADMLSYAPTYYRSSRIYLSQNNAKGAEFDIVRTLMDSLVDQFDPNKATWSISLWEEACGIKPVPSDTLLTRRSKVCTKLSSYSPLTPNRLKNQVQTSFNVFIKFDSTRQAYTIDAIITNYSDTLEIEPIRNLLESVLPAHLALNMCIEISSIVSVSGRVFAYKYAKPLCGTFKCGTYPNQAIVGQTFSINIGIAFSVTSNVYDHELCGTVPSLSTAGAVLNEQVSVGGEIEEYVSSLPLCNDFLCGAYPNASTISSLQVGSIAPTGEILSTEYSKRICGTFKCGS